MTGTILAKDSRSLTRHGRPDEAEVRKTHFKYGYYLDKCLYDEVSRHYPRSTEYLGVC